LPAPVFVYQGHYRGVAKRLHGTTGDHNAYLPSVRVDMSDAVIAQKAPLPIEVEEGKSYFWCSCGKSAKQPFCDGSHKDSGFAPVKFTADASKKVFFCGCKQSAKAPLCDGAHSKL
jgi:CDGSH-type Zn-finger protein